MTDKDRELLDEYKKLQEKLKERAERRKQYNAAYYRKRREGYLQFLQMQSQASTRNGNTE